jgi:small subunit ribosomal protein S1
LSIVDYGVFVRVKDGIEGLVAQNDIVLQKDEAGQDIPLHEGDEIEAEIANIDSQERRITLSMRKGDASTAAAESTGETRPAARASKLPKKTPAADAAGGTIGELIKQKLGAKLATIGTEKRDDEVVESEKTDE